MNNLAVSIRIAQPDSPPVEITLSTLPGTQQLAAVAASEPAARFQALDKHFTACPVGDHAYVRDNTSGLIWTAENVTKKSVPWAEADKACKALGDGWRLPTRAELLTLVDDTRHDPCTDAEFFRGVKSDWYWTGTPAAWSAECAWIVNFSYGYAYNLPRDDYAFVRAVRAAPAGQ